MNTKHHFRTINLVMAIVTFSILTTNASADQARTEYLAEEAEIREVIRNYFDRRYRSRATNQIENFQDFTDDSLQSTSFILSETEKLEIEIYNAEMHHLRYSQFKYFIDFNDIAIDINDQTATVSLIEGHDVVFEISEMVAKTDPIVSKMRNLEHTITLKETKDGWKIVSDTYDDYLWRFIKATNYSKGELIFIISGGQEEMLIPAQVESVTPLCNLPADESVHTYDRSGAVEYAHQYAINPNPAYYYFPDTDCTNFISQAIHHGSNAEEVGSNTYGWYYNYYNSYDDNDYSASWADVQFSYDFITQYYVWDKGPEGCAINNDYAAVEGDLVQFEWDDDTIWDHAMIIVERQEDPYDPYNPTFYIAGHSDDVDDYPLNSIIYKSRRFIRIDRIDGYDNVYLSLVIQNGSVNTINQPQPLYPNPYPAPKIGEEEPRSTPKAIDPYPAP